MDPSRLNLLRPLFMMGGLLLFLALEAARPYRAPSQPKAARWLDNLGITALNSLILYLGFTPHLMATIRYVTANGMGVLNLVEMPYAAKTLLTVVCMDFVLYVWHLLNHEMPTLWRFHRVHHTDLNMDVSTATRFHIGELALSALIKMGVVFFLGADLFGVLLFETLLVAAAQFEHSSLRVPPRFEKAFQLLFVPPSMHRIHHSVVIRERNTNYGTIFSVWDRILGTLRTGVPQEGIRIGVGAYPRFRDVRLPRLLVMPLQKPVR